MAICQQLEMWGVRSNLEIKKNDDMKKVFVFLILLCSGVFNVVGQTTYLVNALKPIEPWYYTPYKYTGSGAKKLTLAGDVNCSSGFTLSYGSGESEKGHVEFDLGGKYKYLQFCLGRADGVGAANKIEPCVVTVHADGRKIMDEIVRTYSVPKPIRLDVEGVKVLRFAVQMGEPKLAVGDPTLWRVDQTPPALETPKVAMPLEAELGSELMPYFHHFGWSVLSPDAKIKEMTVNSQRYSKGMVANMTMALVGTPTYWAYFNLHKQYRSLSFVVGPANRKQGTQGTGWLTVKTDDKIVYEEEIHDEDVGQLVTLDVTDCEMLSFHTELVSGNIAIGMVDVRVSADEASSQKVEMSEAPADPKLKTLPDVCKLMSNIKPYSAVSDAGKQVYDGASDYVTFSMGGVKFSEGFILYEKASFWDDNLVSSVLFDVGEEFDYLSFTAGYLGKSWAMTNDSLRVYADDELVLDVALIPTYPNQDFVVPIKRCRKLRFANKGSGTLDVGAFGVADLVLYRGEPVANDLFVHPRPVCPAVVDLIDLGAPYLHYVSPMKDYADMIFRDGSTKRHYFTLGEERIYKGFLLQTSTHFSLDFGPLSGTDNAAAGAIGAAAVGAAFVPIGAVGGAVVGSTLIGAAAFLMLAAGGTALENSCAAFNTYNEYNSLTFKVACYMPSHGADEYKETLLIGADQMVVAEIALYETMEPQTVTVPIDSCGQLMFWLANTGDWSGKYLFYDLQLSKERLALDVPKAARLSKAVVSQVPYTAQTMQLAWERPQRSQQAEVDAFLQDVSNLHRAVSDELKKGAPNYEIHTYYLETNAGEACKAVQFLDKRSENMLTMTSRLRECERTVERLAKLKSDLVSTTISQASATLGLPSLGLGVISYGKLVRQGGKVIRECRTLLDVVIENKQMELDYINRVLSTSGDVDGKSSTDYTALCPLFKGETPATDHLQLVEHFVMK